ncbi:triple QxxK/R motif-containing protein-like [Clavelina lepadiformis]|uniref:triple QxxK/R motif-containing protein-like n=1 Tax=Clavelina lepadiformis TaxID=159417 RepID=UPI00404325D2
MARKDVNKGSNIDIYRKKIGKQEYRRNKGVVKSIKDTSDAKQSAIGVKEILLVMVAIFVLLATIYLMVFLLFEK